MKRISIEPVKGFGRRLEYTRLAEKDHNLREASEVAGVSHNVISKAEQGSNIIAECYLKVCEYAGLDYQNECVPRDLKHLEKLLEIEHLKE